MKWIVFILALFIVWYMTKPDESLFNSVPDSSFTQTIANLTADQNQAMILATQDYINKYMKLCVYCIETKSIKKLVNKTDNSVKYRCIYMFMVMGGYAYGFTAQVDISMDDPNQPKVLLLTTQPDAVASDAVIVPYTDEVAKTFLSFDQVTAASIKPIKLPTVNK